MDNSTSIKQPLLEEEQLFFLHIPKCAGLTLMGILDSRYTRDEVCPVHRYFPDLKAQVPKDKLATYKFIRGHFPYDLVNLLPRMPRLITFLRHPVPRILSALEMINRMVERGLPPYRITDISFKDVTLDEFLRRKDLIELMTNRSTAYLSGDFKQPDLELAKERLATFDFIGITESFNESLELLAYIFDFPPLSNYRTKNVSSVREDRDQIPQDKLDQIAELNWLDVELYEYGLTLYQEKCDRWREEVETGDPISIIKPEDKPRVVCFDFRRVDPCTGWYIAENHKILGTTRWSGPDTTSTLRISVSTAHDLMIRFRAVNSISTEVLESLRLKVNQVVIPLKRSSDGGGMKYVFEGRIPQEVLESNQAHTRIDFEVSNTISPDPDDPEKASRLLGVSYQWLHLYPV
jgi:hypothetical protein